MSIKISWWNQVDSGYTKYRNTIHLVSLLGDNTEYWKDNTYKMTQWVCFMYNCILTFELIRINVPGGLEGISIEANTDLLMYY